VPAGRKGSGIELGNRKCFTTKNLPSPLDFPLLGKEGRIPAKYEKYCKEISLSKN